MATPSASAETLLSVAEAIEGINNLSDADVIRFKRGSHYLSYGGARPAADLRNEAVRRVAAGTRHCPRKIPLVVTLFGVMRSIASADRKAIVRSPKLVVVPKADTNGANYLEGVDPRLSPEDKIIQHETALEMRQKIIDLFEDDIVAQTLVEGIMDEMEGKELRELVGLNEKEFATKRRFVRRRLDKASPKGSKS